jgi:hypothetical protein
MPGMSHYQRQFVKVMKAVGKYDNGQSFSTLQASEASGVPFGRTGEILDDLASQKVIGRGPPVKGGSRETQEFLGQLR